MRQLQSIDLKLPSNEICGTYDDLSERQKDFQRDIMALEESIIHETNSCREEIVIAERERDAMIKRTSEQLQSVVEKELLLQHLRQMQIDSIDAGLLHESRSKLLRLEGEVRKLQVQIDNEIAKAANEQVPFATLPIVTVMCT